MKYLQQGCTWIILFLCIALECHTQEDCREFWHNNKRYLLCRNGPANKYLALEMSSGKLVPDSEARNMWDSAVIVLGNLSSIPLEYWRDTFSVRRNTWCAWNNCEQNPDLKLPSVKITFSKDKQPGTVHVSDVPGFTALLKRERELVKQWKKEDKRQSVNRWYHTAVLRYDTSHRRVFIVGYAGIAWIPEDSLDKEAHQVLGEVPGLRLESVASPQYHRYIFLRYIPVGVIDNQDIRSDARTVCRVFDTHTMQLLKLPESDNMIDPSFVFCPSGDYVFAVHSRVVAPWSKFSPSLINLREWKKEYVLQLHGAREHMRFYLDRKVLYLQTTEMGVPSQLWALDLSQDEKLIFQYPKNR